VSGVFDSLSPDKALELLSLARRGHLQLESGTAAKIIGKIRAEDILSTKELEHWRRLPHRDPSSVQPKAVRHANLVFVLKVTRLCNLRCTYCRSWAEGPNQVMSFPVMVETVRQALCLAPAKSIEFVLHGGEVTLLKPKVLEKLIWIQQQFKRPDQNIRNSIQTNAVAISDEWMRLIQMLNMSVGLSLDGPPVINDKTRIDKDGLPTSERVQEGIRKLHDGGLLFGGLVVIGRDAIELGPRRLFEYFESIGLRNIDFLNELPDNAGLRAEPHNCTNYLTFDEYVQFLCESFEVWWQNFSTSIDVKTFTDLIVAVTGGKRTKSCLWSGDCLARIFTVEANGDLSACDRYIGASGFNYGSLLTSSLDDLVSHSSFIRTELNDHVASQAATAQCEWISTCRGGCPHDRYLFKNARGVTDRACCGLSALLVLMNKTIQTSEDGYNRFLGARGRASKKPENATAALEGVL